MGDYASKGVAGARALGTIETVYNNREDCSGLSDVEIDKVRDALQVLMYLKQLD